MSCVSLWFCGKEGEQRGRVLLVSARARERAQVEGPAGGPEGEDSPPQRSSPLVQQRPLVGGAQRFRFEQADVFRRLKGERLDQPRSLRRSSRPQSLLARTPSSTTSSSNTDQRPGSSSGSWVDGAASRRDMLTHIVAHLLLSFPTLLGPLHFTNQPTFNPTRSFFPPCNSTLVVGCSE